MPDAPQKLEMPAGAKPQPPEELTIHVMPSEFRGGKSIMSAPTATPPKQVIPPPTAKAVVVKKRLVSPVVLIAGGLFFVAVLGLAAYLLLSVESSEEVVIEEGTEETNGTEGTEDIEEIVEEEPEEEEEPQEPVPGTDSDSDGLTNIEEILFGSDPKNPDTDADTYLDGNEVYHLYNPRGDFAANLTDAGFARAFSADDLSYELVYPSRWTVQLEGDVFIAKVPTGESVRVEAFALDPATDLKTWYHEQDSEVSSDELSDIVTKQGYAGITSPDKRATYLNTGSVVYVISYDLGDELEINFFTTYQMMVNSFLVPAE